MTPFGASPWNGWEIRATDPGAGRAVAELAERRAAQGAVVGEQGLLLGEPVRIKASPLFASGARRHGLARRLGGRPVPVVAEHENLLWLAGHGFGAPVPRGAAVLWRQGLPRYQMLVTRYVVGARALEEGVRAEDGEALLGELGREVARMHSLGFVHHDLFLRNLLVAPAGTAPRVVFLDAWAAGRFHSFRGPSYDVACLLLDDGGSLTETDHATWLDSYVGERSRLDARFDAPQLSPSVARAARGRLRRDASRARRLAALERVLGGALGY